MTPTIGVYSIEDARAIKQHVLRDMRDGGSEPAREPLLDGVATKKKCVNYWLIWLQAVAQPSSGSFTLEVTVEQSADESTQVDIDIPFDMTEDDFESALSEEEDMLDDDDEPIFQVGGGPLFMQALLIANKSEDYPRIGNVLFDSNSVTLNNGWPTVLPLIPQAGFE